jgi:hypothetical protein
MTRATKSATDKSKGNPDVYYTPAVVSRFMISMAFKDHCFKRSIDQSTDEEI